MPITKVVSCLSSTCKWSYVDPLPRATLKTTTKNDRHKYNIVFLTVLIHDHARGSSRVLLCFLPGSYIEMDHDEAIVLTKMKNKKRKSPLTLLPNNSAVANISLGIYHAAQGCLHILHPWRLHFVGPLWKFKPTHIHTQHSYSIYLSCFMRLLNSGQQGINNHRTHLY